MGRPPRVDDLYTRCLQTREIEWAAVHGGEVLRRDDTALTLRTNSRRYKMPDRDGSLETPPLQSGPQGIPRIDVVSDDVLRVRYAEGDTVPGGDTPMVIGVLPEPTSVRMQTAGTREILTTATARYELDLDGLTLRAFDQDGNLAAEIGGPEKNRFEVQDGCSTGIGRTIDGRPLATECFALRPQEAIFGLGEKFLALNQVGQTVDVNMVEALGTTTPRSYKNIPFFFSTRGYGVFFNHSARMTVWAGSRSAADIQVAIEDEHLDYTLFLGTPKHILDRYTLLTGKSRMPPRWSFGFWQSRISYSSAEEALDVIRRNRAAGIPTDVLHLDTHWFAEDWRCDLEFAPARFPDPRGFLAEMASLGVKVSLWQLPYLPEGSRLFDDLLAVDGFVKTRDGDLYDVGICYTCGFTGRVGCIDFTNPEAKRVYQAALERLFDLGARAMKVDFGEQAPLDGVYFDGTPGHRMHNLYPLLYNQAVAEVTERTTGESIIWARSAFAGSQRYPLHWGGDSTSNWHNLLPQIRGGLSLGLSGFPFWSMDIGGFLGETGGALLVRWMQAGVLFSHPRIHGEGWRELDHFDPETLGLCREALRLHYRLLPWLWATARECVAAGLPVSRALVLEFPDDPTTWAIDDQWLLGDALLAAPILEESGRRRVYLPEGGWTDWWTEERIEGPRWITVSADLAEIPLWLRDGAVIPLAPDMDHVDERPLTALTLRIVPMAKDGQRNLVIPGPEGDIEISYRHAGGLHAVSTSPGVEITFEVLGPVGVVVEHHVGPAS